MNKTLQVPNVLHRTGFILADTTNSEQLRLSISSDEPYERYDWRNDEFYWEVLDHGPGGADLSRLKQGAALLYNHDRDILLGTLTNPTCEGGKCYVDAKLSKAPDVQSYLIKIEEKVLKDCSIGYELIDDGIKTGTKDGKPVYKFKFRVFEASMVSIPADPTVGVGRQREEEAKTGLREIRVKNLEPCQEIPIDSLPVNQQKAKTAMSTPATPETPPVIDAKAERAQAIAEFKQRCKKIDEHVAAIRSDKWREIATTVANKHKEGEADFEAFRSDMNNAIDAYTAKQTEGRGEGASGIQVLGERQNPNQRLSIGQTFVRDKGFSEMQSRSGQGQKNFGLEYPSLHCLGARGKAQLSERAGWVSSDLSAINVAPMQSLANTQLGTQRTTILDLITPGTTDKTAIPYPVESSLGSINGTAVTAGTMPRVGTTAEGGTKPRWTPDLTTATAYVSKIAALATVPEEMLSDFSAIQSYIDGRLPYMVDIEAEFQVLYGDGLGTNIRGILSTSGVQTRAFATDWVTTIKKAITDIRVNSFFEPDGIAMHPYDWEVASLEKDLNGQYLAGGPVYLPYGNGVYVERYTYCGLPVAVTTSVTATRPVVGAWKLGAQYFMREGMRVETTNSNKDDFERNMVTIRAEERLALAVYRPLAFLEITGGTART